MAFHITISTMDPYYLLQKQVIASVEGIREIVGNRSDMLSDPRGVNVDIFNTLGAKMLNEINDVRQSLRDIRDSIAQVRGSPELFHISESELTSRDAFVRDTFAELDRMEEQMRFQSSNQKVRPYHQSDSVTAAPSAPLDQLQLHEERLDVIGKNIDMQLQLTKEIKDEMDVHNRLILDIEDGVDNATTAMQKVTQQITQLIENEGKVPTLLVFGLSILLILMLFFMI